MSNSRPQPPEDVFFPVVPMLDMSFQLLAFFILTFQAPSLETRIDLVLPVAPAVITATPGPSPTQRPPESAALDTDLRVHARAAADGSLARLLLENEPVATVDELAERLSRYRALLAGGELKVVLIADDALRYEEVAQILGACTRAGVSSLGLAPGNPGTSARVGPAS